jgi:hypothetical protein
MYLGSEKAQKESTSNAMCLVEFNPEVIAMR